MSDIIIQRREDLLRDLETLRADNEALKAQLADCRIKAENEIAGLKEQLSAALAEVERLRERDAPGHGKGDLTALLIKGTYYED